MLRLTLSPLAYFTPATPPPLGGGGGGHRVKQKKSKNPKVPQAFGRECRWPLCSLELFSSLVNDVMAWLRIKRLKNTAQ